MSDGIYDYVIIGAGSAGSVVAGRLPELGKFKICVMEAGPRDRNPFIHIPAGVLYTLRNPAINWMYKGTGSPGLAGRTGNTAYHSMGTCRMGPAGHKNTVADDQLRVHGIQGLRVADASIMLMMPSANLNASTLMIGEKAADSIAGSVTNQKC